VLLPGRSAGCHRESREAAGAGGEPRRGGKGIARLDAGALADARGVEQEAGAAKFALARRAAIEYQRVARNAQLDGRGGEETVERDAQRRRFRQ